MKREIAFSGILGLIVGLFILFVANWIKSYIPTLVSGLMATVVVFIIIALTALVEMPMMVFALRRMAHSATVSRRLITGAFLLYVSFAAVYASIFVLVTGDNYFWWGMVLAALGLVRFLSGVLVK